MLLQRKLLHFCLPRLLVFVLLQGNTAHCTMLSSFSNIKGVPPGAGLRIFIKSRFRFNACRSSSYFWGMLRTVLSFRFGKVHLNFLNVLAVPKSTANFPICQLEKTSDSWPSFLLTINRCIDHCFKIQG